MQNLEKEGREGVSFSWLQDEQVSSLFACLPPMTVRSFATVPNWARSCVGVLAKQEVAGRESCSSHFNRTSATVLLFFLLPCSTPVTSPRRSNSSQPLQFTLIPLAPISTTSLCLTLTSSQRPALSLADARHLLLCVSRYRRRDHRSMVRPLQCASRSTCSGFEFTVRP